MKGVILHGGQGTRLRPLTQLGPKQLIPIANRPMSWYAVDALSGAGIKEIAIVVSPTGQDPVKQVYGDGSKYGVRITYVVQQKPLGIADAVRICRDFIADEPFVVYLGDNIMREGIGLYAKDFENSKLDALLLTTRVPNPQVFGVVLLDSSGKILKLIEKPKQPPSNLALVGIYFLRPRILQEIEQLKPSWRGEYEITEALQRLIDEKRLVDCREVSGWWKDTGTVTDILDANRLVLHDLVSEVRGSVDGDCRLIGSVSLGGGSRVTGKSVLRGPCVVGENTVVGPGASIGPYTSVGNGAEIRNVDIDNSIIMEGCRISGGGRIVDSIVGANSTVGSAEDMLPHGRRVIVSENSVVYL